MGVRGRQDLQCLYEFRGRGAGHGPRTARRDESADPLYPCIPLFPSGQFLRRHSLLPAGYFARRVAPRLPHSLSGGDECAAPRTRRDRRRPAHPRRTESRRQRPHHQSRRHGAQGAYVYVRERAAHRQFGFGQHAQGRRYLRQAHPRAGHLRHLQPADPRVRRRHSGL